MLKPHENYMKVSVAVLQNDRLQATYFGKWRSPKWRYKLLKKPRKYIFTIHMYIDEHNPIVTTYEPTTKLNKMQLSELMYHYLNVMINDSKDLPINKDKSCIVIRLN